MHTREDENGRTKFFTSYTVRTSDGTLYTLHQPWDQVSKLYMDQRHYYAMLKDVRPYDHSDFDTESITGSEEERKTFKKMLAELYILMGESYVKTFRRIISSSLYIRKVKQCCTTKNLSQDSSRSSLSKKQHQRVSKR